MPPLPRRPEERLPPVRWRRQLLGTCAVLLVLLGAWATWSRLRHGAAGHLAGISPSTSASSLRNTLPEVRYVGDAACAPCHVREAVAYQQHPMGRSCARIDEAAARDHYEASTGNPFEAAGLRFLVERVNGGVLHKTGRPDAQGRLLCETVAPIEFVIGAGRRGRSYLVNRGGYLYQSPISWYADRQVWGLSPHVGATVEPLYRPVQVQCLFCHANRVEPVEHTGNRYVEPDFRGLTIGCERCHGPGALHVQSREQGEVVDGPDDTIVNPRRLPSALREAVCQQCHLQGVCRIVRRGRQPFDYRPGLPLEQFWAVFVRPPGSGDPHKFANHVEQLVTSACYRGSGGALGCSSCHDAHEVPAAEQRVAYYRGRCLECHARKPCALAPSVRRERSREDSCMECHLGRLNTTNIAHVAGTDHRILRRPDQAAPQSPAGGRGRGEAAPLVLFHGDLAETEEGETSRDLGLALVDLAGVRQPQPARVLLARRALPLLEAAVLAGPDDVPAWQGKGYALWLLNHREEALAAFQAALALAPGREEALMYAGSVAAQLGRREESVGYWRRAVEVNPWSVRARLDLAGVLFQGRQWPAAKQECVQVLRLDPFRPEARRLLIRCCLHTGEQEQARREFDLLLRLSPREEQALREWFAQELKSAGDLGS